MMYWGYCMSCLAIYNMASYTSKILGYIVYTKKWMIRIKRCWGCFGSTKVTDCESGTSPDEIYMPLDTRTNSYYFRIHNECDTTSNIASDKVETYHYSEDSSDSSSNYTITQSLMEEFEDESL